MIVVCAYDTVSEVWYNPQVHDNIADFYRWKRINKERDPIADDKRYYQVGECSRKSGFTWLPVAKEIIGDGDNVSHKA